jgi:outer membrane protein assembly factor BamB
LYWANEESGIAYCVNAKDGEVVYKERLEPRPGRIYASGVIGDGKLYYVSRENGVYVLAAEPRFKLLAHNTIASDESIFNATPAISRKQLLLRSDRYLYCIGGK